MQAYVHRQRSRWMIAFGLAILAALFVRSAFIGPVSFAAMALLLLVVAITLIFSVLSTRVDANGVSWAFTLGSPGGTVPLADIADVQITTTNFWEGFGIHWTLWHGWLWNVSGYGAVMIHKRSGAVVTIGTDDPQGFYVAIVGLRSGAQA